MHCPDIIPGNALMQHLHLSTTATVFSDEYRADEARAQDKYILEYAVDCNPPDWSNTAGTERTADQELKACEYATAVV